MSTQHTPGPWEAYEERRNTYIDQKVSDDPDEGYKAIFRLTHAQDIPDAQAQANIRLMVAAPDLLAALTALAATARTFRNVPKAEQEWTPIDDEALDAAFAAIAKARGQV